MDEQNIRHIRGDTLPIDLEILADGEPVDLMGATVYFTMKRKSTEPDENALIQIIVTEHVDAENGITTILIPAEAFDEFQGGEYPYDIQVVYADETVSTIMMGVVMCNQDTTTTATLAP